MNVESILILICSQVDVHPQWAKRLEAHLTAGVHIVSFKARSPTSDASDACRTTLTVKGMP